MRMFLLLSRSLQYCSLERSTSVLVSWPRLTAAELNGNHWQHCSCELDLNRGAREARTALFSDRSLSCQFLHRSLRELDCLMLVGARTGIRGRKGWPVVQVRGSEWMDALGCALTPSHTQQWTIQNRSTANEKSVIQVDMQSARAESLLSRIGCPVKPHRVVGWCPQPRTFPTDAFPFSAVGSG